MPSDVDRESHIQVDFAPRRINSEWLLIAGQVVFSGKLGKLTTTDCTLVPGFDPNPQRKSTPEYRLSIIGNDPFPELQMTIERSIVDRFACPRRMASW